MGSHPTITLLVLHGGPGASHDYLRPLEELGVEVIYFDQLGCGQSDHPDEPGLWTVPRYVDEIEQVRHALGKDRVHLFGHSWGAILGVEYALAHPARVSSLVLSNMMMSIPAFNAFVTELVDELVGELGVPRDHPEVARRYMATYLCRLSPWPEEVTRTVAGTNPAVAAALRGTDPFLVGGPLATWDRTADLGRLAMPTLVVAGGEDTAELQQMLWAAQLLPRGSFLLCPDGSHLPMWDDRAAFVDGIRTFLGERRR